MRPVWHRLAARAVTLGKEVIHPDADEDPALRLIANGQILASWRGGGGTSTFVLPRNTKIVRVVSASRRKLTDDATCGQGDCRRLGVHVERIKIHDRNGTRDVPIDHPGLSRGWWEVEYSGEAIGRWTDGDAVLPLPDLEGPTILEIRASRGGLRYVIRNYQA